MINNICIIANHDLIAEIFAQGKINNDIFEKISQTLPYFTTNTQKTHHIDHIIIDPHRGMADMIRGKIKTV